MLTFTTEQLRRLDTRLGARYISDLCAFAREQFPDRLAGVDAIVLETEVARLRDQAVAWRLDADADVRCLLVLRFTLEVDLGTLPWVRQVINDPFARKIDRLVNQAAMRMR